MKKRFVWFIAATLVLVGLGGMLLLVEWPASSLGRAIAEKAKRDLGVELTGGRYGLDLLEGLVLEEAEATASTEGRSYRAALPRVRFIHRPRSLLSGVFEVRQIVLEAPVLELVEGDAPTRERPSAEEAAPGPWWLSFATEEVRLSDASIYWSSEASDGTISKLQGVDVSLNEQLGVLTDPALGGRILALQGTGEFLAKRSSFGDIEVSEARAQIYLHEGNVSLSLLNFSTAFAPFVAEMRVELQGAPFDYIVSSLGEPFDLGPLLGAASGAFDEVSLLLEVFGRGPTPEGFRAQGSVTLPAGELPVAPLFVAVNEHLGREVFRTGEDFRETIAVIRVRDGYVLFQPFELSTERDRVTFRGRVYLDGELEMELVVHERARGADGELLRLRGTVEHPVVE